MTYGDGSGVSTTTILNGIGLSLNQVSADIMLDMPNNSVFLGQGGPALIDAAVIPAGATLSQRTLTARSATARTRGTDDGKAITFSALAGSKGSYTKRFAYDAFYLDYAARNDMSDAEYRQTIDAWIDAGKRALANDFDSQILALYSSAASSTGGAGIDVTTALLAEARKLLLVANAPRPNEYFAVLPATQDDKLAQIAELNNANVRGGGSAPMVTNEQYSFHKMRIFTTGNVPTATSIAHGMVGSPDGVKVAIRDMPTVKIWDDPDTLSWKHAIYMDWAYVNTFNDWIVDFQTTDA